MAAYSALVSLMHTINQIEHHPRPPISLDKTQVESLTKKVTFLQEFLEERNSHVGCSQQEDPLESRIADAVYAAEDLIESHIVDKILAGSTCHDEETNCDEEINSAAKTNSREEISSGQETIISDEEIGSDKETVSGEETISSIDLYDLQKVMEGMDLIMKELMMVKEKMVIQDLQLHRSSSISAGSLRTVSPGKTNIMVGFDDVLYEMMDKVTGGQRARQILPIVGMGGIGKTTLAKNIFEHQVVAQNFDILAWVTISQYYRVKQVLTEILISGGNKERLEDLNQMDEYELGDKLHKKLFGRRYLIVMDDIWSIEVWEKIKFFIPDYNNRSRIIVTTRLSNVAFELTGSDVVKMNFLDKDTSWDLLCKIVFGEEDCPDELKEIGKKLAENCKGLPLSIVLIGGLLAKSERTLNYWETISENLNSVVNLEDNECCLNVLQLSYTQLPVHLKPCFLYMGIFPEDSDIRVSRLVKLWVCEGFLKPIHGKSLEVVAREYLEDLISRNLVLVGKLGCTGKIKICKIHDLLRDLCLREARKEKFLCLNIPQDISTQRRIAIHQSTMSQGRHTLQSASFARSLICSRKVFLRVNSRSLRIFHQDSRDGYKMEAAFQLVNSRYLAFGAKWFSRSYLVVPPSIYYLWNLHTLIVKDSYNAIAPAAIWAMPQLRHVEFTSLALPDPPSGPCFDVVLGNLQTLREIRRFVCSEKVVKRIPNIKKLRISYWDFEEGSRYCLNNLARLLTLESLSCWFYCKNGPSKSDFMQYLSFPHSLKKLFLYKSYLHWDDMATKIGSLPLLEVLKLSSDSFIGPEWETVEGQFRNLKYLRICDCSDLERWITDGSHFPRLEHLFLVHLDMLDEIPSGIGEIPTLRTIELDSCSCFAELSAERIKQEQEELGNVGLVIRIYKSGGSDDD